MSKARRKKINVRVLAGQKPKHDAPVAIEADQDKIEREKRLFMRVGIGCVMAVFFVAWIINLKYQFKVNAGKSVKADFNWNQTKAQWAEAMAQVRQGIADIKQQQKTAPASLPNELTSQQINMLKGKLINDVATGTASSTKK